MLTVRIPDDLRDAIDAKRGDVPRERIVRAVLRDWAESSRAPAPTTQDLASGYQTVEKKWEHPAPTRPSGHPQRCPKCGGLHKGDCPAHPRAGR